MSYTLKGSVLAPASDVDLSGHAWVKGELRDRRGRWTISSSLKPTAGSGGKHSRYKDADRDRVDSFGGLSVLANPEFSKVDWDGLVSTAKDETLTHAERERAAREVTKHLEQLKHHVGAVSATAKIHGKKPRRVGGKSGEFVADTAKDGLRVQATQKVLEIGVKAGVAASALLGAGESEHMVEAFHRIAENPALEAGVNVALTILITTLIAKILKHFRDRRDSRIAKARGEL